MNPIHVVDEEPLKRVEIWAKSALYGPVQRRPQKGPALQEKNNYSSAVKKKIIIALPPKELSFSIKASVFLNLDTIEQVSGHALVINACLVAPC